MAILDVYGDHWDVVLRGNWHQLENDNGEPHRWACNNAVCLVSTFKPARQRLTFDVMPGPGVVAPSFVLNVIDSHGERRLVETLTGRTTASFVLVATRPTVHALRLFAPGGGHQAGVDSRILDFCVFRIGLEPEPEVVAPASGCRIGSGWHALESFDGSSFRWVENDARIVVEDGDSTSLELELEAGPGVGAEGFDLTARFDRGEEAQTYRIENRTRIAIPLSFGPSRPREILLHTEDGGLRIPGDERVLNFRAFCVSA